MKAFKPNGARWFARTTAELMHEWLQDPSLVELVAGAPAEVDSFAEVARAAFAPLEAKLTELIESDAFAAAVMRGACPWCGAACADIVDESGPTTMHQAPPCERFAALRPAGGAVVTCDFVGYLKPPSPGSGVHLFSEVGLRLSDPEFKS